MSMPPVRILTPEERREFLDSEQALKQRIDLLEKVVAYHIKCIDDLNAKIQELERKTPRTHYHGCTGQGF